MWFKFIVTKPVQERVALWAASHGVLWLIPVTHRRTGGVTRNLG